jgi:alcohol dehydrogenase class IV
MSINNELLTTQIFGASIEFGMGSVRNIALNLEKLNAVKPLIVTDKGVVNAGIVDKVLQQLDAYTIFDDVQPNPTDKNVMDGLDAYRENGCDSILGLGGGSPIDAAKGIRVLASNAGHVSEYYYSTDYNRHIPPLIAIPTTSGTGSEVSRGGVITDTEDNRKKIIISGAPSLALVDPELTLSMPPALTAATGMDALSHSVEAYVAKQYNPLASAIAIAGIKLVAENLRCAVEDGTDMEARKNMAMASTMGALAFSKGLGAVHSLAHQLSTEADVPHGVANAIMLPPVMEFNLEAAAQDYADIAQSMGVNIRDMSVMEAARSSIEAVRQLSRDIGIPGRLRDVGVKKESIPSMAAKAMEDHCHSSNPCDCTEEGMAALYEMVF